LFDYLIIGAGFSGCVLAERLAYQHNKKIILVEKRNHIGGNAYDLYNDYGILIHKYGPHIFHTNNQNSWDYLSNFTEWYHYQHRVLTYVDGQLIPFPVNLDTINMLFGYSFSIEELKCFFKKIYDASNCNEIKDARDMAINRVGQECYDKFFKNYTKKQWDLWPEELASEVTARIPVRFNRDTRYFADKYQGIPKYGYTKMFEKMIDNPNIHILLNTDYKDIINEIKFGKMIYTGPIDYFFDYKYGRLPYRSLKFEFEHVFSEQYQKAGTVNYPNDYDFTRITEFKHLTGQKHQNTTIMREYSMANGEPYYPIPIKESQDLYEKYRIEGASNSAFFVGRLAEYKYYNMDAVVEKALKIYKNIEVL
jgi:UDP-galactopyranose mutase